MSVIIKNMEMPKDCYDCPLHDGETGRCNILGITVCDYIPKGCPLVEVVRCKDCKHSKIDDVYLDCYRCDLPPVYHHFASGFCERGERKDNAKIH